MSALRAAPRACTLPVEGDPAWLAALRAEARRTSIADVASRLGYARPSISLVLTGRYPQSPHKVREAVERVLLRSVVCPHLGAAISEGDCERYRTAPMPTSDAARFRHWNACRVCPLNPQSHEESS